MNAKHIKTALAQALLVAAACLNPIVSVAQDWRDTVQSNISGPIEFKGIVEELSKPIKGAIVTVYESKDKLGGDMVEIKKFVTPGSGAFEMKCEINKMYRISVEKAGYTTKSVDIDTDVRLARPEHTKVPVFAFKVDMVKDTDGRAFKKSVANVYYHIKRNVFDYELDYSKEDMLEEELKIREMEERRKLAELAAQKKFDEEEQAKQMRESEAQSTEKKVEMAIRIGGNDEKKTIQAFKEIFPVSDTLRSRKADVMYKELQKERLKDPRKDAPVNYKSLFAAAQALEQQVVREWEEADARRRQQLRDAKLDAERKKEEAVRVQQQALELQMAEKMAEANKREEERKKAEEKMMQDKVYYAIFNAKGDRPTAISNLKKTYPRNDPYSDKKAEAIYLEYERLRLGGQQLANIDFKKLFAAATAAEQEAIREEIAREDAKQRVKTDAFLDKEQAKKKEEERKVTDAILEGLKLVPEGNQGAAKEVFKKSVPAGTFQNVRAEAMYEEYVQQKQQQKRTGNFNAPLDFGAMFAAADEAEESAKQAEKEKAIREKREQQEKLEQQRDLTRQEKQQLAEQAIQKAQEVHQSRLSDAKSKREKDLVRALEEGAGDREKTVQAIIRTFPKGTELPREKAEAMFDAYVAENARLSRSGTVGAKIDFAVLFAAAEQAELMALQREFESKQAKEQDKQVSYEEERLAKAAETAKEQARKAEELRVKAEKEYETTAQKVERERVERLQREAEQAQQREKQLAMEQAKRIAAEKEQAAIELANLEASRKSRLTEEERNAEEKARLAAEARKREQDLAQAETDKLLAQAERDRRLVEETQRKAEEAKRKEDEKRILAEAKAKEEADKLAARLAEEKAKEQARQQAAALAAASKAEEERKAEAARKAAEAERQKILDEQAVARAAQEMEKRKAQEEAQRKQDEIAAIITKARKASEQADHGNAIQAFEQALAADPTNKDAQAGLKAAKSAQEAAEKAKAAQLASDKQYFDLISKGRSELATGNLTEARKLFDQAKGIKPAGEEASTGLADVTGREQEALQAVTQAKKASEKADHAAAVSAYERALAANPKNKEAQDGLRTAKAAQDAAMAADRQYYDLVAKGRQELAAGNLAEAKRLLEQAKGLKTSAPEAQDALADVSKREQEATQAIAQAKKATEKADHAEAIKAFEKALAADPGNKEAQAGLSSAKAAQEAQIAANKQYYDLIAKGEQELAAGNLPVARRLFEQAKGIKGTAPEAEKSLADVVTREKEAAESIAQAKRASEKADHTVAIQAFEKALAADPTNREAQAGLAAAKQAQGAQVAMDKQFDDLLSKGQKELAAGNIAEAKKTFAQAEKLKPNAPAAKEWVQETARREQELAKAEEERKERERQLASLLQEGAQAIGANNLPYARKRYSDALALDPNNAQAKAKLAEVETMEKQVAQAAEDKRKREEEARIRYTQQQEAEAKRKDEEAARIAKAEEARKDAMAAADKAREAQQAQAAVSEEERKKKFDEIKTKVEKLNLNAEEQRKAFLSELSKLYPQGLTEETVTGKNFTLLRYVINEGGIVNVYEKRVWDWGGVFFFKNSDIAITESLYKLELSRYGK